MVPLLTLYSYSNLTGFHYSPFASLFPIRCKLRLILEDYFALRMCNGQEESSVLFFLAATFSKFFFKDSWSRCGAVSSPRMLKVFATAAHSLEPRGLYSRQRREGGQSPLACSLENPRGTLQSCFSLLYEEKRQQREYLRPQWWVRVAVASAEVALEVGENCCPGSCGMSLSPSTLENDVIWTLSSRSSSCVRACGYWDIPNVRLADTCDSCRVDLYFSITSTSPFFKFKVGIWISV